MFTKRIIPCLDVNNGRVVKGVNFVNLSFVNTEPYVSVFEITQVYFLAKSYRTDLLCRNAVSYTHLDVYKRQFLRKTD